MNVRDYAAGDRDEVKKIFAQHWNDPVFLAELTRELEAGNCQFYVAEKESEIVGVAGLRPAATHLATSAKTTKPAELYIIAAKYPKLGIGRLLAQKVVEEAKQQKFTEIVCYSPETHNSSWSFYENIGFKQQGIINDPDDGYPGMLWEMTF